jgi:hypothetical protein
MICLDRVSFKYLYSVACPRLRVVGEYLIEDVGRKLRLIGLNEEGVEKVGMILKTEDNIEAVLKFDDVYYEIKQVLGDTEEGRKLDILRFLQDTNLNNMLSPTPETPRAFSQAIEHFFLTAPNAKTPTTP